MIVFFQCTSFVGKTHGRDDVIKMISLFIMDEKIPPKDIIIVRVSSFPNEKDYLIVMTGFDPNMPIGKNKSDKDFGQYKYKGYVLSFVTENGIDISSILKNKDLEKISDSSFVNQNDADINYDPITMKFYVNDNFEYTKPFYNTKLEIKWDKDVKKFLKKSKMTVNN